MRFSIQSEEIVRALREGAEKGWNLVSMVGVDLGRRGRQERRAVGVDIRAAAYLAVGVDRKGSSIPGTSKVGGANTQELNPRGQTCSKIVLPVA